MNGGRTPRSAPPPLSLLQRSGERHLASHFNAVRLSRSQRPDLTGFRRRQLIVYLNHTSWWDPLICLHLAVQLMPERRHYAPMEAATLDRHPDLRRLGFFAVDSMGSKSARGARRFLEIVKHILEHPEATLWVTAGGTLADPRERPARAQPGLGHLASRLRHGVLLPLAIEYPFWTESRPEAVLRFGEELAVEDAGMRANDWSALLAAQLESAQDALAAEAVSRDPARFEVLLGGAPSAGSAGVPAGGGGIQDAWRHFRLLLRGRRLRAQHGDPHQPG